MTITAKVIADSTGENHLRITTFELSMPRFILAQFNTHRYFSRNAASSRAIPLKIRVADILSNPVVPIKWGKNQSGMVAEHTIDETLKISVDKEDYTLSAQESWVAARDAAIKMALHLDKIGVHKEIVNRVVEPYAYVKVVVTATNYANFFALRRHKDAQPEIKVLADAMHSAMEASTPDVLQAGEWHLPYITDKDRADVFDLTKIYDKSDPIDPWTLMLIHISIARCARVSYKTHDGRKTTIHADYELCHRLLGSVPLHASPAEHQAKVDKIVYWPDDTTTTTTYAHANLSGNFDAGFIQYRKLLDNECVYDN